MKRAFLAVAIFLVHLCYSQTTAVLNNAYSGLSSVEKLNQTLGGFSGTSDNSKIGFVSISSFIFYTAQLEQLQLEAEINPSLCNSATGAIHFTNTELPENSYLNWSGPENFESTQLSIADLKSGSYTLRIQLFDAAKTLTFEVSEADIADNLGICRVSSEPNSNHNRIWFSQSTIINAKSYLIYRFNEASDVFEQVGELEPSEASFLDTSADNSMASHTYAVQLKDQCDRLSNLSDAHKTILLETSVDANYQVELNWNHYEGVEVNFYTVYRSINDTSFEEIARIDSQTKGYKDLNSNTALNSYSYIVSATVVDCQTPNQLQTVESNEQFIIAENKRDDDQDKVANLYDQCPNSTFGVPVDAAGCEVFSLAADAFNVSAIDASCPNSGGGAISISATNSSYTYHYTLNDQDPKPLTTNQQTVSNLPPGTYQLCISVDSIANYSRCYTLKINEPEPLMAQTRINLDKRRLDLQLSGSNSYTVTLNGQSTTTTKREISLNLKPGLNRISVTGELPCQAGYNEDVFVSEEVRAYPNPTTGPIQLFVAGRDRQVKLIVSSLTGTVVRSALVSVPENRLIATQLFDLHAAVYLIKLEGETVNKTLKVIKN